MEHPEQQLLEALRAFLQSGTPKVLLTADGEWQRFWTLAAEQKVLPMAAEALSRAEAEIPPEIRRNAAAPRRCSSGRPPRFPKCTGSCPPGGCGPWW